MHITHKKLLQGANWQVKTGVYGREQHGIQNAVEANDNPKVEESL